MTILIFDFWVVVLFYLDDGKTRGAYGALSRFHRGIGESVRLILLRKSCAPGFMSCPELLRRVDFWTPWTGTRRIYAPPASNTRAFRRFQELQRYPRAGNAVAEDGRQYVLLKLPGKPNKTFIVSENGQRKWEDNWIVFNMR